MHRLLHLGARSHHSSTRTAAQEHNMSHSPSDATAQNNPGQVSAPNPRQPHQHWPTANGRGPSDGGRDSSRLLRGTELEAAERWRPRHAEGKKPPPTPL